MQKIFSKPALSLTKQVELLESRGLIIPHKDVALHHLSYISFYRLSGYTRFFMENKTEYFKDNITFERILDLYTFDRELRLLLLDAIEKVEVAVRTMISNVLSEKYGAHWFLEPKYFRNNFRYQGLIDDIEYMTGFNKKNKKQNPIFSNYYDKYKEPKYPPSWMLAEGLTLGTWSKIYDYLVSGDDKHEIAKGFGVHFKVLQSWLQSLTHIRNICAHHERVWNRRFHITPCAPKNMTEDVIRCFSKNHSLYPKIVMLHLLLNAIVKNNNWPNLISSLLQKHAWVPIQEMGFPKNWNKAGFWKLKGKTNVRKGLVPA